MPVTVVGRPAKYFGKSLYAIACNLKDFGAGRVVYRQAFQRYKEPTYFRIIKVQPAMDPELTQGVAWVESVWRGENVGVWEIKSGYKEDFRLVAKEDEESFCNRPFEPRAIRIMPSHTEFPPLLKLKIMEELAEKGEIGADPKLQMVYAKDPRSRHRAAEKGETPVELVKNVSMNLYEGIADKRKSSTGLKSSA